MFFSSFQARATNLVWLPRATIALFLSMNFTDVYARVLPTSTRQYLHGCRGQTRSCVHLSQITSPLIRSPILPPALRYVTLRSVDTPVEYKPRDASASEPLVSTMVANVAPCRMPRRFVWCFSIGNSKLTLPGSAAIIFICTEKPQHRRLSRVTWGLLRHSLHQST
jgi:hypothetical protein